MLDQLGYNDPSGRMSAVPAVELRFGNVNQTILQLLAKCRMMTIIRKFRKYVEW